jgi:carbonic anhydrase
MRIRFLVLAGVLVWSQSHAADQLIKLPQSSELEAMTKGLVKPPPPKEPAQPEKKEEAHAGTASEAKPSASTPQASAPQTTTMPATADAKKKPGKDDDLDADEIAHRISAKLAELRKQRATSPLYKGPKKTKRKKNAEQDEVAHRDINHWDYAGDSGPTEWGKINPAWSMCAKGERQSPIDIHDGIRVDLESIAFDYKASRFAVVDNGHTIQVNMGPGNRITVGGRTYDLVQFHFHRPSEERVNGKSFPMVAHLVHKDADGRLAVVALLIEEGAANAAIQSVWNNLPLERNDPSTPVIPLDPAKLLPAKRDYYTFMGSLTTPPCTEGVLWIVLKQPIHLSAEQIAIFSRLYPMNARPIQTASGRIIKESD